MLQTIGENLSTAVGIAISPLPIVIMIVLLTSKRAVKAGSAFGAGWLLACLAGIGIAASTGSAVNSSDAGESGLQVFPLVLGLIFLFLAFKQFTSRPAPGTHVDMPDWLNSVDTIGLGKIFLFGVAALVLNPKNLTMYASIGASIAGADLSGSDQVWTIVALAVVGTAGALVPLALYLLAGDKAPTILGKWRVWLIDHNAIIMTVLFVVLGFSEIGKAFANI